MSTGIINQEYGKIWQTADNLAEAYEWQSKYFSRGAASVELRPYSLHNPTDKVDVIVEVPMTAEDVVNPVLDYKIGTEEWMTPVVYETGATAYVKWDDDTIRIGTIIGHRVTTVTRDGKTTIEDEYLVKWWLDGEGWVRDLDLEVHLDRMMLHFQN